MSRVVLVGGGVATTATAAGLRSAGFDGDIVLVADEEHLPYERPPLSKEYLAGTFDRTDFQVNHEGWYPDNDVDLLLGTRAVGLDVAERRVFLSDGGSLAYDSLVLGTGARAKTLPGFGGQRVHVLRTIADAERLGAQIKPGRHLAVLGAGFVGCELAAVAAGRGARVTVFSPGPLPLRSLGPEIGEAMLDIHREQGVEMRMEETVTSMTETIFGLELHTSSGAVIECDELLVGVGSVPNAEIAAEAGIKVDGGILTDEHGRTSAPNVYAIGDVAARYHPRYERRIRVEHHDTAMRHGANLARNLLGESEPFTEEHYFWSHQYDHNLQSLGYADGGSRVVRGSVADRSFSIFSVVEGQIRAMVALNRPQDLLQARKLMAVPHQVTGEQLSDEEFSLKSLLPQRTRQPQREVRA
ncbi:NAD(P)/FAD-dependent oxidoreductase [Paenarthrobacter sp. NPDC089714]|uniref:NAD(P)/FAD-dependent oxidoreductase n=1 Tax=Paenarthrobacter sp. NPDC089714 TaxID=3364377 RepID=UPI0037F876FA